MRHNIISRLGKIKRRIWATKKYLNNEINNSGKKEKHD
jgi:hypothetical protein